MSSPRRFSEPLLAALRRGRTARASAAAYRAPELTARGDGAHASFFSSAPHLRRTPLGGWPLPMIIGAHSITYSTNPELDRALLRDVFKLPHVDVGHGWLIFGLPPAEGAVHPSEKNDVHEFYLMCDDVDAFVTEMRKRGL